MSDKTGDSVLRPRTKWYGDRLSRSALVMVDECEYQQLIVQKSKDKERSMVKESLNSAGETMSTRPETAAFALCPKYPPSFFPFNTHPSIAR